MIKVNFNNVYKHLPSVPLAPAVKNGVGFGLILPANGSDSISTSI